MLKDAGYQEKFEMLAPWIVEIIEIVKKDLKNEHLKMDREFCKRYFLGKNFQHVQAEEMSLAYQKDIAAGNVGLGEFIASRWLLKNTDIYGYFEEKLKSITPEFEEMNELDEELSQSLMQKSVAHFGATRVYLFCVLNSVVFPVSIYQKLRILAEKETHERVEKNHVQKESETIEVLQKRHARELSSMEDRYEKKLIGLQKKYLNDVNTLKKQIGLLQKKLSENVSR